MKLTVTLLDGEHELSTPTWYATALMEDMGVPVNLGINLNLHTHLAAALAALLTEAEPLDVRGNPSRVWSLAEAARLVQPTEMLKVQQAVRELIEDGFPQPKPKAKQKKAQDEERPTNGRASATK